jgi:hypothetical protein
MKKITLALLALPLLLAACGGAKFKTENGYYLDEKFHLKFSVLGEGWEKQDPGEAAKHGTIHFFFNPQHHARIWIRAIPYENAPALPLKEGADSYVERKASQYHWDELQISEEDFSEFNGEKSFWKVYEYKIGSKTKKEKIYRVYHEKISYQFRFRCSKERFDGLVDEFDTWLDTIEFISG